jgi:hypothetical protein
VELVGGLRNEDGTADEAGTTIWECADQDECVGVCRELLSTGIRYHVDEITLGPAVNLQAIRHYRILISSDDLDRAKKRLGIDEPQNTIPSPDAQDDEVVDPAMELPDAGLPLNIAWERRRRYLDAWYPEDATVEVWSQDGEDLSSGIALALDANYIRSRCDSEVADGKKILRTTSR